MKEDTKNEETKIDDAKSDAWLKGCEICNSGLCAEMDKFIDKHNMSERKAAKRLAQSAENVLGFPLYSPDQIRDRYRYNLGKKEVGKIPPPQGDTTAKAKGNSKTAPRISYTVGTAALGPKQTPDNFQKLSNHALRLAEGLQQWADGNMKPKSEQEIDAAESIKGAAAQIIRQYARLGIRVETSD